MQLRAREFWLLALAGPGNVSQHEMAELCGLDPSSLVAVLDSMERRGWLRRRRNPRDRRIQWVQRTQAGDRLFSRALPLAQQAEAQQLAVLSAARQRQLVAAMGKLVMSAQAAGRGVKRMRNSADLAAPGESVVRDFLESSK